VCWATTLALLPISLAILDNLFITPITDESHWDVSLSIIHIDLMPERWNLRRIRLHDFAGKNLFFGSDDRHTGKDLGLQGQFEWTGIASHYPD
jgi:hypothetical protein